MKVTRDVVEEALESERRLIIISLAMLDNTERVLSQTLSSVLEFYGRPEMHFPIYTAIKEVALNGVKANMKRITYLKHRLNPHEPDHREEGVRLLKERIEAGHLEEFARESHRLGYMVSIEFVLEPEVFFIEVKNNTGMSLEEDRRIRHKLRESLRYDNVADFFLEEDQGKGDEGAGLGMTLISVMLRSQNIDPHCFVMFSKGETTVGRLEIPIAEGYQTRRQRWAMQNHLAS